MAGVRRAIELTLTEKPMRCPNCHTDLIIGTVMGTILMSRRTCPNCGKDFLIENDRPRKLPGEKKPSGSVKPAANGKPKPR